MDFYTIELNSVQIHCIAAGINILNTSGGKKSCVYCAGFKNFEKTLKTDW